MRVYESHIIYQDGCMGGWGGANMEGPVHPSPLCIIKEGTDLRILSIYSHPSFPLYSTASTLTLSPPISYQMHLIPSGSRVSGLKGGKARSQQLYLDLDIKELKNRVSSHYSILRTCLLNRIILT